VAERFKAVVLKQVPLGSLRKLLIPGRNFFPTRNWEGKAVDEKNLKFILFVYSTHKKLHNEAGLDGNVYSTQAQAALTAFTDLIKLLWNYLFCDLLLGRNLQCLGF